MTTITQTIVTTENTLDTSLKFEEIEKNKKVFGDKISQIASMCIGEKSEKNISSLQKGLEKRIQAFEIFVKPHSFLDHDSKLGLNDEGLKTLEFMKEAYKKIT